MPSIVVAYIRVATFHFRSRPVVMKEPKKLVFTEFTGEPGRVVGAGIACSVLPPCRWAIAAIAPIGPAAVLQPPRRVFRPSPWPRVRQVFQRARGHEQN